MTATAPETLPGTTVPTATDCTGAALTVTRGPGAGHHWPLAGDATTVLGRHPDCDVVLAHVTVSRRHAEVRPDADGFVLVDTGSLAGLYLNRSPVRTTRLADGDEIAIGAYRLTFHAPV
ncbi:MAG: FHA domain-containing protein [Pseudonocardia sp.]|jgi:pSer/pThr/pTyr-binding forkhead associated (FHA) protein